MDNKFKDEKWYKDWIKLFEQVLIQNGMRGTTITGFCMGIDLVKIKTVYHSRDTYKLCKSLITISTSAGINDWYITDVHNLGGK